MSNIPLARSLIREAVSSLPGGHPARTRIEAALELMTRNRVVKRTRAKSRNMSMRLACEVWRYYRRNPGASHQEMADHFGINPGRISEVLTGTKYPEAKRLSIRQKTLI